MRRLSALATGSHRLRDPLAEEHGSALIEFALASALFFTTIFGTISFSLAIWQYNVVGNLSKEGARWAAVRGSSSSAPATATDVETYVRSRAFGMDVTVTTTWPDSGSPANKPGNKVRVQVLRSFTPLTALVPVATLNLRSTTQLTIAR